MREESKETDRERGLERTSFLCDVCNEVHEHMQ